MGMGGFILKNTLSDNGTVMKTRLTNLKRISNRQYPSAALAAGDVAFFALGQIPHDRTLSAAAFLFEPVLRR